MEDVLDTLLPVIFKSEDAVIPLKKKERNVSNEREAKRTTKKTQGHVCTHNYTYDDGPLAFLMELILCNVANNKQKMTGYLLSVFQMKYSVCGSNTNTTITFR